MDRRRTGSPVYSRQWSGGSSSTGSSSPAMSPAHPHSRLPPASGFSTIKRTQNVAAKAAAQRLAQVMASQTVDDEEEDDDLGFRYGAQPPPSFSSNLSSNRNGGPAISLAKPNRSPSPAVILEVLCIWVFFFADFLWLFVVRGYQSVLIERFRVRICQPDICGQLVGFLWWSIWLCWFNQIGFRWNFDLLSIEFHMWRCLWIWF